MWTMIWTFIKNPANIVIVGLVAAVTLLSIFATGQYIALGVKDVKLAKQDQVLKTKDATIGVLTGEKALLNQANRQVQIQVKKERDIRKQYEQIATQIKEGMTNEEAVGTRNFIIDMFNDDGVHASSNETGQLAPGTGNPDLSESGTAGSGEIRQDHPAVALIGSEQNG